VLNINTDDNELLDLFIADNNPNEVFKIIIKKYQSQLYRHIRKMVIDHDDTNDILQNTLIKAWKGLKTFNRNSQLYTWLYRIATNETLNFLNNKKRKNTIPLSKQDYDLSQKLESDPWFDGDEAQKKLQKAILSLPDKQRLVFNLRYFDEIPYEEMSKILETSEGALKASYHHAVKKIENYLNND